MGRRVRAGGLEITACSLAILATLAAGVAGVASAQQLPTRSEPVLSSSGQFIIHSSNSAGGAGNASGPASNQNLVRLEPAFVGVSCERIKQALSRDISLGGSWQGRIYVEIRPARTAGPGVTITSERFRNGWQYRVEFPDMVERDRYTRAVVHVVLLEAANRSSSGRWAEVPLWLTEGLTRRLLASREIEIILLPPRETVNRLAFSAKSVVEKMDDPVGRARQQLHGQAALTFDQLSWQVQDELSGSAAELYRTSAQLFLGELLRLRDGRACLATTLQRLPRHLNWQLAFLDGFSSHFERLIDVEKWWALCCVQSPEKELVRKLPTEGTWDDLEQALLTLPQARAAGSAASPAEAANLQTIIRDWARVEQRQVLSAKRQELDLLRTRLSPDLALLAEEYCKAIEIYLQSPYWSRPSTLMGKKTGMGSLADETLQRLDSLDARRGALRPAATPLTAGNAETLGTSNIQHPTPNIQ
jgi:hypothetical protein